MMPENVIFMKALIICFGRAVLLLQPAECIHKHLYIGLKLNDLLFFGKMPINY